MGELTTATPGGSTPMLVVVSERALGQTSDELGRTIRTLRRHNLVVKVMGHAAPHPEDARG
ncbi:MAG TPA: hypothetical protein VKB85_11765 [Propionibacteriaceae bacterium]|nr:hypothetical protein [Propionibacteriaceae bacterium]